MGDTATLDQRRRDGLCATCAKPLTERERAFEGVGGSYVNCDACVTSENSRRGLPLTTGEGISAERLAEIRYEAERLLRAKFRLVDQAEDAVGKSVLELLAECGRLREQLAEEKERRQRDFEHANYIAKCAEEDVARLREQLDAARQALEQIADGTWNVGTGKNLTAREFARAALGVEGPSAGDGQP